MRPVAERFARARRRSVAFGAIVTIVALAALVAWASHQFTDVSVDNPFHLDIHAVGLAGITAGKTCDPPGTPPTFCPSEPITREAMAAFMHRGLGRTAMSDISGDPGISLRVGAATELASVTIDVGGVQVAPPGQRQFVMLHGTFGTCDQCDGVTGVCPPHLDLLHHAGRREPADLPPRSEHELPVRPSVGCGPGVVQVLAGSTQTFRLMGESVCCGTPIGEAWGTLTAITVPFGSTGGGTLGVASTLPATGWHEPESPREPPRLPGGR